MKTILWQGDFGRLNSLALVNDRLIKHLGNFGYKIYLAPTDFFYEIALKDQPDIYIFHGYPFDYIHAPGKFNVFLFQYEYMKLMDEHREMVDHINNLFDLVIVYSEFVKQTCLDSGFTLPIEICHLGFDPKIFNGSAKPYTLPTSKGFVFLNLGGPIYRKGFDLLIDAYTREFTDADDVALIIKSFSYFWLRPWAQETISKYHQGTNKPEIHYIHRDEEEIAGFYAASDMGVYPYRGEGFGLTILESIACGRPVIVTEGGSTDDFCTSQNAHFVPANLKQLDDKYFLEPDLASLRSSMRAAYETGPLTEEEKRQVSASVSSLTWEKSALRFRNILNEYYPQKIDLPLQKLGKSGNSFAVIQRKKKSQNSSWDRVGPKLTEILALKFGGALTLDPKTPGVPENIAIVIGKSGESQDDFLYHKRENPDATLVLINENFHYQLEFASIREEFSMCGLEYALYPNYNSINRWYQEQEFRLADHIVALDRFSSRELEKKLPHQRVHQLDMPLPPPRKKRKKKPSEPLVFLFVGTEPLRRGARILFQAWDELSLENAELLCLSYDPLISSSEFFLKYLIQNPNITLHSVDDSEDISKYHEQSHVHVAPALWDTYFQPVADSLSFGNPIITTHTSGTSELLSHKRNSYLIESGSVDALKEALLYFYTNQDKLSIFTESCHDTARQYSVQKFSDQLVELLSSVRKERS